MRRFQRTTPARRSNSPRGKRPVKKTAVQTIALTPRRFDAYNRCRDGQKGTQASSHGDAHGPRPRGPGRRCAPVQLLALLGLPRDPRGTLATGGDSPCRPLSGAHQGSGRLSSPAPSQRAWRPSPPLGRPFPPGPLPAALSRPRPGGAARGHRSLQGAPGRPGRGGGRSLRPLPHSRHRLPTGGGPWRRVRAP